MSITSVSLSSLEASLLQSTTASTVQAPSTTTGAVSSAITDTTDATGSAVTALTKDLLTLLKSLINGDVSDAQTDLGVVLAGLKAQGSYPGLDAVSTNATVTSNPLVTLLASISKSLSENSTAGALQELASYLVTTGLGKGNLVNTSA